MSLKGTKTAKNLMISFAGEAQATFRYNVAAKQAQKEGYVQIQKIDINCKTVHGCRRKVQNSDINCKIAHGCRRKVQNSDINCKIVHGCRRKVQNNDINCKIVHGCRRKVQNNDINCKIVHGWGFGVNSATKKGGLSHHCS
jgi:hypothetical protein